MRDALSLSENNPLTRKIKVASFINGSKVGNLICLQTVLYVTSLPIRLVDLIQPRVYFEALRFATLRLRLRFHHLFINSVISTAT